MKLAEYEGADVFDLEIQALDPDYWNPAQLRPIFETATKPIFTVFRRRTLRGTQQVETETDEERMRLQLDLLDVGSLGFDLELDTFDPQPHPPFDSTEGKRYSYNRTSPPREITTNPRAVERQMLVIEEAHRRGGDVLASTHNLTRLTPDGALAIGRLAEARGADAVKIVQFCACYEDVVESLMSTVVLKRELKIPYILMAGGEYGKLTRAIAPLFGSMLVFARQDYLPGGFLDQPPIRAMRSLFSSVDLRISKRADWFLPKETPEVVGAERRETIEAPARTL
jgi:hypothetical protein